MKASRILTVVAAVAMLLIAGGMNVAWANVSGAIFTTTVSGTTVNGNIYDLKTDVYLNGGPQNGNDPGLVPDGLYYFQVTDPSGAVLLSADDISCRQVQVTGGRIVGVPSSPVPCTSTTPPGGSHPLGAFNGANGEQPVQLCPATPSARTDNLGNGAPLFDANNWCDNTPNPGGEYKAWLTPVGTYSPDPNSPKCSSASTIRFGFCDSDSKTDNFKVKKANVAYVRVCKFNDLNGDGTQETGEPLIPFWPITGVGVDLETSSGLGTVNTQTDETGCVSFSVSTFPNQDNTDTVTLTETVLPGWQETAPLDGTYDASGNSGAGPTSVSGFTETITVKAGDDVTAPNFGNFCASTTCGGQGLVVTKDANPSFTRTFTWGITKSVDNTIVHSAGGGASNPANYTVSVTHDAGTDSGWQVTGTIKVSNPNPVDISGVNVTDAVDNGGSCTLTGGTGITVPAHSEKDVPYTCTYSALPAAGTNTATASWDSTQAVGTASVDFTNATFTAVDGSVKVTDPLDPNSPETVSYTDPSPTKLTYSHTFTGDPAGTCTSHTNTATFTTSTTSATDSASQTVQDCQGANLTVSKTANPSFTRTYNWSISKSVDKTKVDQVGGSVVFNYTVNAGETGFTDGGWQVNGSITVTNPNDWEAIIANVTDTINNGGSCTVTGGTSVSIPASGSKTLSYTCTYASAPSPAAFTNTAKAYWDKTAASTPSASALGTASSAFGAPTSTVNKTITVTDTFNGVTTTLGTLTATDVAPLASSAYKYSHTIAVPKFGCLSYTNTATIVETKQTASQTVTVCGPEQTGALTMGFWQNKNGQGIITGGASTSGVCNSGTWLRQFAPFQDLGATANCAAVATYVTNIIKAANATLTGNAMLKGQMLATSLDVYFSDPGLGGNKIGAPAPIGGDAIDLTKVCKMIDSSSGTATCSGTLENVSSVFGGATSLTVSQMLAYAASQSNVGGSTWYGNVKSLILLAKDAFDAINNQVAFAP